MILDKYQTINFTNIKFDNTYATPRAGANKKRLIITATVS